jgi:hypothetical protein
MNAEFGSKTSNPVQDINPKKQATSQPPVAPLDIIETPAAVDNSPPNNRTISVFHMSLYRNLLGVDVSITRPLP